MSDTPTDQLSALKARRTKVEPYVYACSKSTRKIKFPIPVSLHPDATATVLAPMAEDNPFTATRLLPDAFRAWIGDDLYRVLVDEERLVFDDLQNLYGDAMSSYDEVTGGPGESDASPTS